MGVRASPGAFGVAVSSGSRRPAVPPSSQGRATRLPLGLHTQAPARSAALPAADPRERCRGNFRATGRLPVERMVAVLAPLRRAVEVGQTAFRFSGPGSKPAPPGSHSTTQSGPSGRRPRGHAERWRWAAHASAGPAPAARGTAAVSSLGGEPHPNTELGLGRFRITSAAARLPQRAPAPHRGVHAPPSSRQQARWSPAIAIGDEAPPAQGWSSSRRIAQPLGEGAGVLGRRPAVKQTKCTGCHAALDRNPP